MTTTIHAIYESEVFRPLDVVDLPEKSKVEISVVPARPVSGQPALARLLEIAEQFRDNPDLPTAMAAQHDQYLFGTPKRP
jgi:predicted DNA-binding antitoxin AbrB/MazE fold protein